MTPSEYGAAAKATSEKLDKIEMDALEMSKTIEKLLEQADKHISKTKLFEYEMRSKMLPREHHKMLKKHFEWL